MTESEERKFCAEQALAKKWRNGDNLIMSTCPFCDNAGYQADGVPVCKRCLCPQVLCANKGKEGVIGYLAENFFALHIGGIPKDIYDGIIKCLIDCTKGELSEESLAFALRHQPERDMHEFSTILS